jgi:hypothetical protein
MKAGVRVCLSNTTTNKKVRKMKKNITSSLVVLTLLLIGIFVSACTSDTTYVPGTPTHWTTVNVSGTTNDGEH